MILGNGALDKRSTAQVIFKNWISSKSNTYASKDITGVTRDNTEAQSLAPCGLPQALQS